MNDLIQLQIKESCKLALPNGLRELMEDISREVLRAQPDDLYDFITHYLGAMLEARDHLAIAVRVCEEVYDSTCHPELGADLRDIGLSGQTIASIEEIVEEYFKNGRVNEQNLLITLSKKLDLESKMLPAVQEAVRSAYRRHFFNNADRYENYSKIDCPYTIAAKNTVKFHQRIAEEKLKEEAKETNKHKYSVSSTSSMSLAGSFLNLPKYVPYSAMECSLSSLAEDPETERINIDYTMPGEEVVFTREHHSKPLKIKDSEDSVKSEH